jgi:hypothetical protein
MACLLLPYYLILCIRYTSKEKKKEKGKGKKRKKGRKKVLTEFKIRYKSDFFCSSLQTI